MRISTYMCGMVMSNCYIVQDEGTGKAVIIDAGEFFDELKEHIDRIGKQNIEAILLTHCHFDHVLGAAELKEYTGAPLMIHANEEEWVDAPGKNGLDFFFLGGNHRLAKPDRGLSGTDTIQVGDLTVEVMHTPGHSPGSSCFIIEDCIFSGDTLFHESYGRTDLPGGNRRQLLHSMKRLDALNGNCKVYPGHGEPTTIDHERKNNPIWSELY